MKGKKKKQWKFMQNSQKENVARYQNKQKKNWYWISLNLMLKIILKEVWLIHEIKKNYTENNLTFDVEKIRKPWMEFNSSRAHMKCCMSISCWKLYN